MAHLVGLEGMPPRVKAATLETIADLRVWLREWWPKMTTP